MSVFHAVRSRRTHNAGVGVASQEPVDTSLWIAALVVALSIVVWFLSRSKEDEEEGWDDDDADPTTPPHRRHVSNISELVTARGTARFLRQRKQSVICLRAPTARKHLTIGAASLGCMYSDVTEEEARETISAALDGGVTHFDVAPSCECCTPSGVAGVNHCRALALGLAPAAAHTRQLPEWCPSTHAHPPCDVAMSHADGSGLAECRLGKYLQQLGASKRVTVSTKCGYLVRPKGEADVERVETMDDGLFHDAKCVRLMWTRPPVAPSLLQSFRLPLSPRTIRQTIAALAPRPPVCPASSAGSRYQKGAVSVHWDYREAAIRASVADSLRRLRLKTLPVLRLHSPESREKMKEAVKHDAVGTMVVLEDEGRIGRISIGMNRTDYTLRILKQPTWADRLDSVLLAGQWNLLDQGGLPVLRSCWERGIAVINAEIFCSGAIWGQPYYDHKPITADVTRRIDRWRALVAEAAAGSVAGLTLPELALHFALLPGAVERVCIGVAGAEQVRDNLRLFSSGRSAAERQAIGALFHRAQADGLLRDDVDLAELSRAGAHRRQSQP